jgi:hypothetical protein
MSSADLYPQRSSGIAAIFEPRRNAISTREFSVSAT